MNIVVATTKSWNTRNAEKLKDCYIDHNVSILSEKEQLTDAFVESTSPDFIFFPHWSWIIPASIYENYNCVVFHMTDLPFGRGGSPLQNLIVRGIYQTKISAIKVSKGMDTGDVYFKEELDISFGNADEILSRASDVIFEKMIPRFLSEELTPVPQVGEVVKFKRRTPEQSEIPEGLSQRQIYDYIRMLDGEGYPTAFSRHGNKCVYYTDATFDGTTVMATARFVKDSGEE